MGQSSVNLKEVTMEIHFNNNYKLPLPLLVNDKLDIDLHMPDLEIAINNIKNNSYQLADFSFDNSNNKSRIKID